MFYDYFSWFCKRVVDIFNQMKCFELFSGFTFYNFVIFLIAIPMFIKILHLVMAIEDTDIYSNDSYTSNYDSQYDSNYHPKHGRK